MSYVYRIKHPDGSYSKGGMSPYFSKKGKVWNTRGGLSNHLALLKDARNTDRYKGCTIEVYELSEVVVDTIPVSDWTLQPSTIAAKKAEERRQAEYKIRRIEAERVRLQKMLDDLK